MGQLSVQVDSFAATFLALRDDVVGLSDSKNSVKQMAVPRPIPKDLLYRRMRCLANYEAANKNLERARGRNKDIPKFSRHLQAETEQQEACKKFEDISALAKTELKDLKKRRVLAFKKNLADLADLEIKHAK
ncbi:hypothetical protein ANCCEY_11598, partial [Ancylostoma ceylanicum]